MNYKKSNKIYNKLRFSNLKKNWSPNLMKINRSGYNLKKQPKD